MDVNLENRIKLDLIHLGFKIHLSGFKFLCRAVILAIQNPKMKICDGLYSLLSNEFKVPATIIERDIRFVVHDTSTSQNIEKFINFVGKKNMKFPRMKDLKRFSNGKVVVSLANYYRSIGVIGV